MSTEIIECIDSENHRRIKAKRFATSIKNGAKTNNDVVRVSVCVRGSGIMGMSFDFNRQTWAEFRQAVDESFAECPVVR